MLVSRVTKKGASRRTLQDRRSDLLKPSPSGEGFDPPRMRQYIAHGVGTGLLKGDTSQKAYATRNLATKTHRSPYLETSARCILSGFANRC